MRRRITDLVGPAICAGLFLGILAGLGLTAQPASAGSSAQFLGGMLTNHVAGRGTPRYRPRTTVTEPGQQQPATQPGGAAGAAKSAETRLDELDALAARGYITKEEYQQRRKAILDGM